MTNGVLFYWISWIFWIIVTFLMKKRKKRSLFACWILLSILFSNLYLTIQYHIISVSFLVLLVGSIIWLIHLPRLMYHLFSSFTITIGYTAILLWEKNAPVWLFLPRVILISFILGLIIVILVKDFDSRTGICLLGMSCGEIFYSFTLSSYGFHKSIGEMQFFDNIILIIVIITILDILHKGIYKLFLILNKYKQSMRWQNE